MKEINWCCNQHTNNRCVTQEIQIKGCIHRNPISRIAIDTNLRNETEGLGWDGTMHDVPIDPTSCRKLPTS